jgi:hypothetical protein
MIQGLRGWNCCETKPQPGTLRELGGWVGGDEIDDDPLSAEIDLGSTLVQGNGIQTHPAHTYTYTHTNQSSRDFGT